MTKRKNRTIRIAGTLFAALSAAVIVFFIVSMAAEYKPAARETALYYADAPSPLPDTLTILSWNIGYAGLGDNMDFFYDGGRRVRDTRERTAENLQSVIETLRGIDADIMLLQEVDAGSRRSYGIREIDSLRAAFPEYTLSFALNYRSWWVPIPLRDPMGRVRSGVVTMSRAVPVEATRYQYPSSFPFPQRMFNLKRCLLASLFLTAAGDTVLIGNTHNTAYDTGGMRTAETRFLSELLGRYAARGVSSVTGGDWNQYPPGYEPSEAELSNPFFVPEPVDATLFGEGFRFVADSASPSLRYLDRPYAAQTAERPQTTLTDFFLLSAGVRVLSVETLPLGFRASDHNPVRIRIVLPGRPRPDTE